MMEAIFAVGTASVAERLLVGKSALVSFANIGKWVPLKSMDRLVESCARVVLDSGAFTAWTQGRPIELAKYISFVREHAHKFAWIAALDAIGDGEQSLRNWVAMCEALPTLRDKIVPVYHEGEPITLLDTYVAGAAIVGVGRTEGRRDEDKTYELYDAVFNRHPNGSFHAFGCSVEDPIESYPWLSFDSTTWERNSTYGNKFPFPFNRCDKELRMRAYISALEQYEFRGRRARGLFDMRLESA